MVYKVGIAALISLGIALLSLVSCIRGPGIFRRLNRLASTGVFGAFAVLFAALYGTLYACLVFSDQTLVGTVRTRPVGPKQFELVYEPASVSRAEKAGEKTFRLNGDQWTFSGAMIKWHPIFSLMGIRNYHRPLRIGGQFSSVDEQRAQLPTVESIGPGKDYVWEWAYWLAPKLPFLDAVYGSAAYGYVDAKSVQQIYVTPSGYMIKRLPR